MTTFDEREKGSEAKFRMDQETTFKVTARRNKLLGLWAAEKLNLRGPAAEAYAKEVVAADFEKPGDSDIIEKVLGDFKAKGMVLTEPALRKEMDRLRVEAQKQVLAERKS
jgi:hypothetical protein